MGIKQIKTKDKEEWLKLRKNYIGGSDAGAVIGTNPYKSAYTLWAEKTGKIPEFEGNLTTEIGSFLEEKVADLFEQQTGKKVIRRNATLVNEEYPWACADLDRKIVNENAALECKTTNSFPIIRQIRGNEFPDQYYAQCVHYLAVTGYDKVYLAVLSECRRFDIFELERDQAEIDALMKSEEEFWGFVETNTPPAVDGSDSTSDTLLALYPESNGNTIDLMPMEEELNQYWSLKAQNANISGLMDEKANLIKDYMKDAEKGVFGNYSVSFKSQVRRGFDYKKLIADRPDMDFSAYFTESESRPFQIRKKGEKKNV